MFVQEYSKLGMSVAATATSLRHNLWDSLKQLRMLCVDLVLITDTADWKTICELLWSEGVTITYSVWLHRREM